ncbi:hypothetical protein AMATHDRAFT_60346 [Amanita thiersii Skay4041]|uniref:Chitin synthase export chaperone n=1 Tax=Amanita thiersii Skay4041 TaxID=703135 RepID=A0A2A9NT69_9AGAR|nr:hypothetical protein AMATHDRAFT_60346 [Amanita thiersii Skay4041]
MENLPLDTSHPAVRDYLTLVRLQVLTPLSLLINIATVMVCALITSPTIGGLIRQKPTAISPNPAILAVYVAVLFLGQIGYCVILVLASKQETKRTLTKGVGMSLVAANFIMALWAIVWIMKWFIAASILQGLLLLFLLYSSLALYVYHPATSERPLDTMFIHAPIRFFVTLVLLALFPYCLFVALGLIHEPTAPGEYLSWHTWAGFGIVAGTNLLALLVVVTQLDIVWCIGATWVCISMWAQKPKPTPVYATTIACTILHPLALLLALAYVYYDQSPRRGRIALPPDREHYSNQASGGRAIGHVGPSAEEEGMGGIQATGPQEIDPNTTWG